MEKLTLTPTEKLKALAAKYYQFVVWTPKAGDLYTSARADLELYRVVKIEEGFVYTEYCTAPGKLSKWEEDKFTTVGFGLMRVWVPPWVLDPV